MSKPLRVLVVEDSEDDALLLAENLRKGGYEPVIERVETEADMLAALREKTWDIVLSDYSMPQFDAPGAIRTLRESGVALPLIVISGTVGEDVAVETLKLGADDYMLKQNLTRLVPAVARAIAAAGEVAARKESQELLRLTLERLQLAVKAAKAGIWDYDPATGEMSWDAQMQALYSRSADTLEPGLERWYRSVHPEDLPRVRAAIDNALRDGAEAFDMEFRIFRKDDDAMRNVRAMGAVVRGESGPVRVIGINWDVTDERSREDKLAEALSLEKDLVREAQAGERAKGDFLAMISHEIRTPMNGVLGFAELLCHAQNLPEDCRNYAQTIVQSGESLLRILDEILDYIQLEAGDIIVEKVPFSPRALFQELRALLAPAAAEKQLKLHTIVDDSVPESLVGDAVRLRQILLNLAGNAIKFTDNGSVTIGLWPLGEPGEQTTHFEFSVKDTGAGIATAQMERIFRPFTQADSSASRRHGGTGLGLSVCRRVAELLGGGLAVRSQPGVGSEFLIEMPLGASVESTGDDEDSLAPFDSTFALRHPLRILLVEDDRVNLKLVLALVRRLGYEPLAAQDGLEAVEVYLGEQPDCVFMDLQMPELDGIEATMKIRAHEKAAGKRGHVFIAALTANIFPAERRRCFDAGMNGYLNKPVKISSLARMLAQAGDFTVDSAQPGAA